MSPTADTEFEDRESEWEHAAGPEAYLLEHLGALAADTEDEAEAEAFLGALVPLAAKLFPALVRSAPTVVRGVARLGRQMRRHPAARTLVRTLPTVVRRTAMDLSRAQAAGRRVTATTATRSLARQTSAVLGSKAARERAVRRCRELDRRWRLAQRADIAPQGGAGTGARPTGSGGTRMNGGAGAAGAGPRRCACSC